MSSGMHRQQEVYRQQIIGRLQRWESNVIRLRSEIRNLESDVRLQYESRMQEIEARNRNVFNCYADLLLANNETWDEKRAALDAAADQLEGAFIDFAMQAV